MRKALALIGIMLAILACQVIPTPPPLTPTSIPWGTVESNSGERQATEQIVGDQAIVTEAVDTQSSTPGQLYSFKQRGNESFAAVDLQDWSPDPFSGQAAELPFLLAQVDNPQIIAGLTVDQREFLSQNGFVILHSREAQFGDIRERAAFQFGQPYFLTTDAAHHALHLAIMELMPALESEELAERIQTVVQATLGEVLSYLPFVTASPLEQDIIMAAAYLGVGLRLMDPMALLDPRIEQLVSLQVEKILSGSGLQESILFPGFIDDYSSYVPVGHYAGDPDLEAYFRGMTWFGRVHFPLEEPALEFIPSRAPLIITLALRRARVGNQPAAEIWQQVDEVLNFLVGPGENDGPLEYAALMDEIYGLQATILDLHDEALWRDFQTLSLGVPAPTVNSLLSSKLQLPEESKGWRFLGQHFIPDVLIFQSLVYDRVGTPELRRDLPSGLDVMAVLGSQSALQSLEGLGAMRLQNYQEQMDWLRKLAASQQEKQWLGSAYGAWLYSYLPGFEGKRETSPPYMRSQYWGYKELNSALGSWAELKHDASLVVTATENVVEDNAPASGPAPAFVEPNPEAFYRLAYIADSIFLGLIQRNMLGSNPDHPASLQNSLASMKELGERLRKLGDLAAKELGGEQLTEADRWVVLDPLGPQESRMRRSQHQGLMDRDDSPGMPPVPMVATVAGAGDKILQVAVGLVDRILVIVPVDGGYQIAQGGVYSYYEFPQLRSERVSDEVWRKIQIPNSPDLPSWSGQWILPGGAPVDFLAFRVGDVYQITLEGDGLNMRTSPSLSSPSLHKLGMGEYVMIVDGPVEAEGSVWWKLQLNLLNGDLIEGWAVENQGWYQRAWRQ